MRRISNQEIARMLEETAALYEMTDVPFKPRAYEKAAASVAAFGRDIASLYKEGGRKALDEEIPGVGAAIAEHIEEILKTGTFKEYERLHKKVPVKVRELNAVQDIGPKTILLLWKKLKIRNLKELERAARAGKIREVKGLGAKTEENILRGIGFLKASGERKLLGYVLPIARRMVGELERLPHVKRAAVAGSVRRMQETIGDIDLLVTTSKPEEVMAVFTGFPEVRDVLEHGKTKTTVRLANGMLADVRVIPDESFGAALQYFTGDKSHNIEARKIAIKKGYKLNDYGLWIGKKSVAGRTEEEIYKKLGLALMPPEIRTASGEIEAAMKGTLPKLIEYVSLRGDLQVQTDWTDGDASIEEMARAAKDAGLEYMAVTDHTKALAMTGGLDEKKLERQGRAIDALNKKLKGFRVLKGTECDVKKDGSLDLNNKALSRLDVAGVSVHSHFKLSRAEQTKRVLRVMENPHADILMHPTGRQIGRRPPIELDMEEVAKAAARTGTALEIDAYPDRLDLRDEHVRMAVRAGAKLVVDSDAHHPSHFQHLELGVAQARRGWATKKDVLNTRPVTDLMKWFRTPKHKRK